MSTAKLKCGVVCDNMDDQMRLRDCIVSAEGVIPYPAPEIKSTNRRLIGEETVGAKNIEIVLGVAEPGSLSRTHTHSVEQVIYVLEGGCTFEMWGEKEELGPQQAVFIPPNAPHQLTVWPGKQMRSLLIFAPPVVWGGLPPQR